MSRVLVPAREEMDFYDIRTTLQALCAVYDNCNSLHTNAYDEAVTTPSAHSVRRVLAIQMIIDKEWGLAGNENPLQGSFILDQLTHRVSPGQRYRDILGRGGLQVADDSFSAGLVHIFDVGRVPDQPHGLLAALGQEALQQERDLPVPARDHDAPAATSLRGIIGSSHDGARGHAAIGRDLLGHRAPGS